MQVLQIESKKITGTYLLDPKFSAKVDEFTK